MYTGLQKMLDRKRQLKDHLSKGECISDFREERVVKDLPKEKPMNPNSDTHDECFVMVPDVHSYLRDKKAVDLFMRALPILHEHYNLTKFIQMGDLLECGQGSSHPTNSVYDRVPPYLDEIEWAMDEFWKPAIKSCPNANFYALMGNHENRWNKKIAKEMMGGGKLSQDVAINTFNDYMPMDLYETLGIHVLPYGNETVTDGVLEIIPDKLVCMHGWSTATHSAKTHLNKMSGGYSVIHGHTHRSQHHRVRNPLTGANIECWSFGSLAKVEMKWHGGCPTDHVLGFGIVLTHGDTFTVQEIPIHVKRDGTRTCILPNGDTLISD